MKTIKVKESDFKIWEYYINVSCPYCKQKIPFYTFVKYIDVTDYCPNCGKEIHVISEE